MDNNTQKNGDDKYIFVYGEELLYAISDAGLLDHLEEIVYDKKYKFRLDRDVKSVTDKFFAEKKSKKNAANTSKENKGE